MEKLTVITVEDFNTPFTWIRLSRQKIKMKHWHYGRISSHTLKIDV